ESLYAFPFGGEVESQEPIPAPDSTPQQGPIEGSLVLFELPASASENRPLTLFIAGPEGPAEVKLDLESPVQAGVISCTPCALVCTLEVLAERNRRINVTLEPDYAQ